MVVAPSWKETVPVGVPAPGGVAATVAVKLTDWPNTDGFNEEVTRVLVLEGFTVWSTGTDVLRSKVASPL
jgi:hypothetical protein